LLACIIIILYQREEAGVKRAAHGLALLRHASRRTRHSGGVAIACLLAGISLGQQRTQKPSSLARSLAASYFSSHCWDNPLVARAKRERKKRPKRRSAK